MTQTNQTSEPAEPTAAPQPERAPPVQLEAPVRKKSKKKKKKKKKKARREYTWGLGLAQEYTRAANKAGLSLSRAAAAYWESWDKSWDESAHSKRNGGIADAPQNYARATARAFKQTSKGIERVAGALPKIKHMSLLRALFPPLWFIG